MSLFCWVQIPFCDFGNIMQMGLPVLILLLRDCIFFIIHALKKNEFLSIQSLFYIIGPLLFGLGFIFYMAKTTSHGGLDVLFISVLLCLSSWSLIAFTKELNKIKAKHMEARFAWMNHSLKVHTDFLHDELHRYQTLQGLLDEGKIEQVKDKLNKASNQLTELFHDLSCNSLPLRLALLERKSELEDKGLKISITVIDPDFPNISLPTQFDFYLSILDFVVAHSCQGVLSIRQEKSESYILLTILFSMKEIGRSQSAQIVYIGGFPAQFIRDSNRGKLFFHIL